MPDQKASQTEDYQSISHFPQLFLRSIQTFCAETDCSELEISIKGVAGITHACFVCTDCAAGEPLLPHKSNICLWIHRPCQLLAGFAKGEHPALGSRNIGPYSLRCFFMKRPNVFLPAEGSYSSILTPSSPAERRQIRQKSSPWEDKTVKERRKRKQSNCFLATHPFPGKMRSCISAAVEKAQARCGVQCQCIDSQDRMCAQEVSKPRSAAAQKRL
ncbi:uncharacterized protein LOC125689885 [Lagopus muta]|uniref:uncharacterized protein LOC125689885 n=1 Tax=Lagopus muta TaxID=64668 RepID=UPI00209E89D2|nr:uncharacterized protein LOC125689885 [Lagopus muta]